LLLGGRSECARARTCFRARREEKWVGDGFFCPELDERGVRASQALGEAFVLEGVAAGRDRSVLSS
jgi:hypothetical protein